MRIKFIHLVNLGLFLVCFVLACVNLSAGDIVIGIFDFVIAGLNLFSFLLAAENCWNYSPEVPKKFVFTCSKCGHQFIPSFWVWFFVPHLGSRRYLKCEKCGKRTWMRRK